jgi:N-acetyl-anhydromuramyl-L-alanine amidase AmpD
MTWLIKFIKSLFKGGQNVREENKEKQTEAEAEEIIAEVPHIDPMPKPEAPKGLLFYPKGTWVRMPTSGRYRYGYPEGIVLHYTSGWDRHLQDAMNTIEWAKGQGFSFDTVSVEGKVLQGAPLDQFGAHAGVSQWPNLGDRVSRFLRGIEVQCGGKVDNQNKTWFGRTYKEEQIRELRQTTSHWGQAGKYVKATDQQFEAVTEYICWLYENSPLKDGKKIFQIDLVLGHMEVSGMAGLGYWRKADPGGSWPMPMNHYRDYLKQKLRV